MNLPGLDSVFNFTWNNSLRACVLIIVVLVVQALAGKRLPARFRYALSLLVLLRLIVPVTPASSWSVFNLIRRDRPSPAATPNLPSAVPAADMVAHHPNQQPAVSNQSRRPSLVRLAAEMWLCGGAIFFLAMLWHHRKFARWVAQLPTATDPRLLELVEQCKGEAGVRCAVRIASAPKWDTAAVYGFRRPCLLLPERMLDTLERREGRLVLLHELVHIRRHDVFVNWIGVVALALHWFNPLAWVAMRRLRADQELACDAAVLGLIEQAERGAYGRTLLKHLHDFPAPRMAAGLVPLITSRHNIKRRIIMITEFKQTGGVARALFAVLLVALGGLTFTRAADEPKAAVTSTGSPSTTATMTPFPQPSTVTPPPKTNRDYGAEYVNQSTLLEQLKELDSGDHQLFIQTLSVTAPDAILNSLLEQEMAQETKLAGLKRNQGLDFQFQQREEEAVINDLKQKIDQRVKGIIAGMSLQVAALKAAAKEVPGRVSSLNSDILSHQLEDWGHQRVAAESDYLEYSNILFNLNSVPSNQLGAALATAYAHQLDPELIDLAARLQAAKARMVEATNNYGAEMPVFRTAKKQLEDAQIAYQDKIDAVVAGIRTRVNEDKGFLQIIQQKEDEIANSIAGEPQKSRP
jgi:beta-lactamase regulating signal transducer with metallopeptidase domain